MPDVMVFPINPLLAGGVSKASVVFFNGTMFGSTGASAAGGKRILVLIIDKSVSMGMDGFNKSIDTAHKLYSDFKAEAGPADEVFVITFAENVTVKKFSPHSLRLFSTGADDRFFDGARAKGLGDLESSTDIRSAMEKVRDIAGACVRGDVAQFFFLTDGVPTSYRGKMFFWGDEERREVENVKEVCADVSRLLRTNGVQSFCFAVGCTVMHNCPLVKLIADSCGNVFSEYKFVESPADVMHVAESAAEVMSQHHQTLTVTAAPDTRFIKDLFNTEDMARTASFVPSKACALVVGPAASFSTNDGAIVPATPAAVSKETIGAIIDYIKGAMNAFRAIAIGGRPPAGAMGAFVGMRKWVVDNLGNFKAELGPLLDEINALERDAVTASTFTTKQMAAFLNPPSRSLALQLARRAGMDAMTDAKAVEILSGHFKLRIEDPETPIKSLWGRVELGTTVQAVYLRPGNGVFVLDPYREMMTQLSLEPPTTGEHFVQLLVPGGSKVLIDPSPVGCAARRLFAGDAFPGSMQPSIKFVNALNTGAIFAAIRDGSFRLAEYLMEPFADLLRGQKHFHDTALGLQSDTLKTLSDHAFPPPLAVMLALTFPVFSPEDKTHVVLAAMLRTAVNAEKLYRAADSGTIASFARMHNHFCWRSNGSISQDTEVAIAMCAAEAGHGKFSEAYKAFFKPGSKWTGFVAPPPAPAPAPAPALAPAPVPVRDACHSPPNFPAMDASGLLPKKDCAYAGCGMSFPSRKKLFKHINGHMCAQNRALIPGLHGRTGAIRARIVGQNADANPMGEAQFVAECAQLFVGLADTNAVKEQKAAVFRRYHTALVALRV